jgi:hypothetical protein
LSEDAIKSASEGATKAFLDWTEERVRNAVKQFLNRKLAFIKDADNIDLVKSEKQSSEYALLGQFIPKGGAIEIQVQMGLALREMRGNDYRITDLVKKLIAKYGTEGLHIAELTEIGIITQLLARLTKLYPSQEETAKRLSYFLDHIGELAIFVRAEDFPNTIAKQITLRIEAYTSHLIIALGSGHATGVLRKALQKVREDHRRYYIEETFEQSQLIAFIYTPELRARISEWPDFLSGRP